MLLVYFKQKSAPKKKKKKHDGTIHNLFPPFASPFGVMHSNHKQLLPFGRKLFGVIKARESSHQVLVDAEALWVFFQRFCCLRFHLLFSSSDLCVFLIYIIICMIDMFFSTYLLIVNFHLPHIMLWRTCCHYRCALWACSQVGIWPFGTRWNRPTKIMFWEMAVSRKDPWDYAR